MSERDTTTTDAPEGAEVKLTDEQASKLATLVGLDAFDADALTEKVEALKATPKTEPEVEPTVIEDAPGVQISKEKYDELLRDAASGREAKQRLDSAERDAAIDGAISAHKISPGERKEYADRYDADPEGTKWFIEKLPVNDELVKTYGEDGDGLSDDARETTADAEYRAYVESTGRNPDDMPSLRKETN